MFYRELHTPYLNYAINPNCHETTLFAVPAAQSDEYRFLCPTRGIAHRPAIEMCIRDRAVTPYASKILSEDDIVKTFGLNEEGMIKQVVAEDWEKALIDF